MCSRPVSRPGMDLIWRPGPTLRSPWPWKRRKPSRPRPAAAPSNRRKWRKRYRSPNLLGARVVLENSPGTGWRAGGRCLRLACSKGFLQPKEVHDVCPCSLGNPVEPELHSCLAYLAGRIGPGSHISTVYLVLPNQRMCADSLNVVASMRSKKLSPKELLRSCSELGPEDGLDPRIVPRDTARKVPNRKALQLCNQ